MLKSYLVTGCAVLAGLFVGFWNKPQTEHVAEKVQEDNLFIGKLETSWLDDQNEREFQLLRDFAYVDPTGKLWLAEKDTVVNGASIPRAFWSAVGSPASGPYRRAAVIHDAYCLKKTESWEATHEAFYQACLSDGLSEWKSRVMYLAVYHFGPRWEVREDYVQLADGTVQPIQVIYELPQPQAPTPAEVDRMMEYCKQNPNIPLADLRKMDPRNLPAAG